MSMGGHFFPNMNLHGKDLWAVSRLLYLHFPPDLVCRSWDYGLSAKSSPICNRMSGTWSNYRFILWKHITLICQHDKLPLVRNCFCMKYTQTISVRILFLDYLKNGINNHVQISSVSLSLSGIDEAKLFSVITQPWRHPGAILCFHVIIDIFISIHHKLTKFNTHKLQVISQHTDNPCPRARHDAHVRARQNFKMLKITYKQFWARTRSFRAFQNFPSVRVRARVVRARSANEWQKFKIFTWFGFLIPQLTISIDFQSLLTFHKAVRARQSLKSARAAMGNIMQKWGKNMPFFKIKIALKNHP